LRDISQGEFSKLVFIGLVGSRFCGLGFLFGRSCGDDDLAGSHDAIVELKSDLSDMEDFAGRLLFGGQLGDGFVQMRIEGLVERFDLDAMVPFEHAFELLADHLEAFDERVVLVGLFGGFDGTAHVIPDGEEVADEVDVGVSPFFLDLAIGPLAVVFEIGGTTECPVLCFLKFVAEPIEVGGEGLGHGIHIAVSCFGGAVFRRGWRFDLFAIGIGRIARRFVGVCLTRLLLFMFFLFC